MNELYELKEALCNELKEYSRKNKMGAGDLEVVDKLAHAIKNLDKIIEKYDEGEYSEESYAMGRQTGRNGQSYRGTYIGSYENRGRQSGRGSYESYARGRNARRDSMGRYSSDNDMMVEELRELMEESPDEKTRTEFERFIKKLENM